MKNEILYAERKRTGMNLIKFAEYLGIPVATYVSYEDCKRTPRQKHMKLIMEKLELKDPACFYPHLHISDDESDEKEMKEHVAQNICDYMNAMSKKRYYDVYEVSMIRRAVRVEYLERTYKKIKIKSHSEDGIKRINEAIAKIATGYVKNKIITARDVELFKKCRTFEYENRSSTDGWEE